MSATRGRWLAGAAATLLIVLGVLHVVRGTGAEAVPPSDRVVVVGVPGLRWTEIDAVRTPALFALVERGGAGALTVRAGSSFTCPRDGWVTLGAGNRAQYTDPAGFHCSGEYLDDGINLNLPKEANDRRNFGAEPGLLGAELPCVTVFGDDAVLAVSQSSDLRKSDDLPSDAAGWSEAWNACPLTLVSFDRLFGVYQRAALLATVDAAVATMTAALDESPGTTLIVTGVSSTPGRSPKLSAAIVASDSTTPGLLRSASTDETPFVQLIDIAPTVLHLLDRDQPSAMVGRPVQLVPENTDATDRVSALLAADTAARVAARATTFFLWTWVALVFGLCVAAFVILVLRRRRDSLLLHIGGIAVATLPTASFLANVVPWWDFARPGIWLIVSLVAMTVLCTAIALGGPWRNSPFGPALAVAAVSALCLGTDVVTGSRLQLSTFIGYSPIVAGRFTGLGNIAFGVFATCGVALVAAVTRGLSARHARLAVAYGGLTLVLLDGGPGLGSDFGGVLALVPAVLLLGMIVTGVRPSPVRVIGALLSGVVVVAVLAVADYQRPVDAQTHLGRFVGQVLDGTALTIVQRKGEANIHLLLNSPVAFLVPVLALAAWWLMSGQNAPLRPLIDAYRPTLSAAITAIITVAVIGSLINDSGVAVLLASFTVAVPLAFSVITTGHLHRARRSQLTSPAP